MLKNAAYYILLFAIIITAGCTVRPSEILSAGDMRKILSDLHKAESIANAANFTYQEKDKEEFCYQFVLEKHQITQAEFDSSLVWYTNNPSMFERIYERVFTDLQEEEQLLLAQIAQEELDARPPLKLDFIDSTIVNKYAERSVEPYNTFIRAVLDSCILMPVQHEVQYHIFPIGFKDSTLIDSVHTQAIDSIKKPKIPKLKFERKKILNNSDPILRQKIEEVELIETTE